MLTLKLCGSLADEVRQVLNVISCCDTESADKILGSVLKISVTIIHGREVILGPAEVSIAGDRGSTIELIEPLLSLGLSVGVEALASKVFIRRNTLLGTETSLSLTEFLFCGGG